MQKLCSSVRQRSCDFVRKVPWFPMFSWKQARQGRCACAVHRPCCSQFTGSVVKWRHAGWTVIYFESGFLFNQLNLYSVTLMKCVQLSPPLPVMCRWIHSITSIERYQSRSQWVLLTACWWDRVCDLLPRHIWIICFCWSFFHGIGFMYVMTTCVSSRSCSYK